MEKEEEKKMTKKIVLDSNEFIFAFMSRKKINLNVITLLLANSSLYKIVIPSLILEETFERVKIIKGKNYASRLRNDILSSSIQVIDLDEVPQKLIQKYEKKGLKRADASIAAFTEWVRADVLISENRHFLKELKTDKFLAINAEEFLSRKT